MASPDQTPSRGWCIFRFSRLNKSMIPSFCIKQIYPFLYMLEKLPFDCDFDCKEQCTMATLLLQSSLTQLSAFINRSYFGRGGEKYVLHRDRLQMARHAVWSIVDMLKDHKHRQFNVVPSLKALQHTFLYISFHIAPSFLGNIIDIAMTLILFQHHMNFYLAFIKVFLIGEFCFCTEEKGGRIEALTLLHWVFYG